jgi:hypothetical protein
MLGLTEEVPSSIGDGGWSVTSSSLELWVRGGTFGVARWGRRYDVAWGGGGTQQHAEGVAVARYPGPFENQFSSSSEHQRPSPGHSGGSL